MHVNEIEKSLSWQYATHVNEICQPLFNTFGINYFDYARFYHDDTCIVLYSDPEWVNCFINNIHYVGPPKIMQSGSYLWGSYIDPNMMRIAKEDFKHEHGITLIFEHEHYSEVMNFSAPPDNVKVTHLYLNRLDLLRQFGYFFIEQAKEMIVALEQQRLSLLPHNKTPILQSTLSPHSTMNFPTYCNNRFQKEIW